MSGKCLNILVLDDDVPFLESFKDLLSLEGHLVYPATRGLEALDLVRRVPLDLSFLDCDLPDLDGLETFVRIRLERPRLPAIFVSGSATPALERRVREAGGLALIGKPFEPRALRVLIQETMYRLNPINGPKGDLRWRN